jgi:chemotaxis protein histidine kinase CheA
VYPYRWLCEELAKLEHAAAAQQVASSVQVGSEPPARQHAAPTDPHPIAAAHPTPPVVAKRCVAQGVTTFYCDKCRKPSDYRSNKGLCRDCGAGAAQEKLTCKFCQETTFVMNFALKRRDEPLGPCCNKTTCIEKYGVQVTAYQRVPGLEAQAACLSQAAEKEAAARQAAEREAAEVGRRAKQAQAATQQRAAEAQQRASQQLQAVSTERDSLYEEKTLEEDGQRTLITKEERQRREISEAFDLVRYEILGNTERVEAPDGTIEETKRQAPDGTAEDTFKRCGVRLAVRSMGCLLSGPRGPGSSIRDMGVSDINLLKYQGWVRPEADCEKLLFQDWDPYLVSPSEQKLEGEAAKQALEAERELQGKIENIRRTRQQAANGEYSAAVAVAVAARDPTRIRKALREKAAIADELTKLKAQKTQSMNRRLALGDEQRTLNEQDEKLLEIRADCAAGSRQARENTARIVAEILRCHGEQREHDGSTFKTVNLPWNEATGRKCSVAEMQSAVWRQSARMIAQELCDILISGSGKKRQLQALHRKYIEGPVPGQTRDVLLALKKHCK